jgi:Cdc6-like AAA superfamily ATPase
MEPDFDALIYQTGTVFTPGAPINERDLFSGRKDQVLKIIDAVSQRGCHAILYGERGTGKTSLSNMISAFLAKRQAFVVSRTNCDISDSYSSLWTKAFKDIEAAKRQPNIGFVGLRNPLAPPPPDSVFNSETPDGVRRTLQDLSSAASLIVIFDEFDRIRRPEAITAMADTIKALSDHAVNATVLIIGVADSVDELIREHQSIERALVQVHMPAMSANEIRSIIIAGFERLNLEIDFEALEDLVNYSQGVPYITHLLCVYSLRAALEARSLEVLPEHVERGMHKALDQWQQSIKSLYNDAIKSAQNSNFYKEVLLACALAQVDDQRYFTLSAVKAPLSLIRNANSEPAMYARALRNLSEPGRGCVLHRIGEGFRLRYRLFNPILRPYIIMRGVRERLIDKAMLELAGALPVEEAEQGELRDHAPSV